MGTLRDYAAYLAEFAKHPVAVGSPIPTFRRTVDRLLDPLDWKGIRLVVEYGAGTGRFTAGILERLPSDGTLVALDTSPGFTEFLEGSLADSRLRAVTASALDIRKVLEEQGLGQADCILSGIPFSTLGTAEAEAIVEASFRVLRPGGYFVAYQVRDCIRRRLGRRFSLVREAYEWLNLPPYHLYWFRK